MPKNKTAPVDPAAEPFSHTILKAAIEYAKAGLPVFPLSPGSKIPLKDSNGLKDATTDLDTIKEWWIEHPEANIGIPTGKPSGLWALDVDMGMGKVGKSSLAKLRKKHVIPITRIVKTPSGGFHFLFKMPDDKHEYRNTAGSAFGRDIDTRGDGGYIAAAPSRTSAGSYVAQNAEPAAPMPKWIQKRARRVTPLVGVRPRLDPASIPESMRPRIEAWTLNAVDGEVARLAKMQHLAVAEGDTYKGEPWDNTCFSVACRLVEIAAAPWSTIELGDAQDLFMANAPRDRNFDAAKHVRLWNGALTRAAGEPLPLPFEVEKLVLLPFDEVPTGIDGTLAKSSPDDFIDRKEGLLAHLTAKTIMDNLAVGTDGTLWSYDPGGVWKRDRDVVAHRLARLLRDKYRSGYKQTVEDILMSMGLPRLSGSPHERYINTRSGMYDWRTGEVIAHAPEFYSTVQLPITLERGSTAAKFQAWAEAAMGANYTMLMEVIGYMLLNGNPLQRAVLFHGGGGNGKGLILRLLGSMMDERNTSSVTLRGITEDKFEVANLFGKLANLAGDIDAKYLRDSSRFKAIVGQDQVTAQFKYRDPFSFTCWAVPVFSANELWRSADTTDGYFRRWVLVPFTQSMIGRDKGFTEKALHKEIPGIFLLAMHHLRKLMEREEFSLSPEAEILRADFIQQSDTLRVWLAEDDQVQFADPSAIHYETIRTAAYDSFKRWADANGQPPLSSTKFYARLEQAGYASRRVASGRFIVGLKISNPAFRQATSPLAAEFDIVDP